VDGIFHTKDAPERLAEGVHLLPLFGNATCVDTGDGLVVVDTCVRGRGPRMLEMIRSLSDAPIRYVIYTTATWITPSASGRCSRKPSGAAVPVP
jgi:hypothetical protein